jgi:hypothetical protein
VLKTAAEKLINYGNQHCIEFDMDKTELIHFHANNRDNENITLRNGTTILAKNEIKWLGIWFDKRLKFKTHVKNRIASATRVFHSIERLSNTSRGLSFQAIRQLYMACITMVADYGVPIWWNQQKNYLEKFQKLQNAALRKILGAFKTTPIAPMEIEAAIPPVAVRFGKICKNYALRVIQMQNTHPIRQRLVMTPTRTNVIIIIIPQ